MTDTYRVGRQHDPCRWLCDTSDVEPGERLKAAREAAGLNRAQLAQRLGYSVSGVGALENGQNKIKPDVAELLAPIVRSTPEWLLYGRGDQAKPGGTVPLVGYVGAGAAAHFYASADEGLGEVEAPPGTTPQTRAAEIRGESLGPLFDTWLVFYDDVRTPVTPDLIGKLCIVGLPDDKVLVKKIQRSRTPGLFHLLSNNEAPMLDQEVIWAAKVKTMRPR